MTDVVFSLALGRTLYSFTYTTRQPVFQGEDKDHTISDP